MDDPVWDHSSFAKNRNRLLNETVARAFFGKVLELAEWQGLVSSEHFTVDGTLIEAWASMKSFKAKDGWQGKASECFHGCFFCSFILENAVSVTD
jgi:transposase